MLNHQIYISLDCFVKLVYYLRPSVTEGMSVAELKHEPLQTDIASWSHHWANWGIFDRLSNLLCFVSVQSYF
jgi:hypothetical protein